MLTYVVTAASVVSRAKLDRPHISHGRKHTDSNHAIRQSVN